MNKQLDELMSTAKAVYRKGDDIPQNDIDSIFHAPVAGDRDYLTPLKMGKDWLYAPTTQFQPRTGKLLASGSELMLISVGDFEEPVSVEDGYSEEEVDEINSDIQSLFVLVQEICGQLVFIERGFWNDHPSDDQYGAFLFDPETESLPLPIQRAYYHTFHGLGVSSTGINFSGHRLPKPLGWAPVETHLEHVGVSEADCGQLNDQLNGIAKHNYQKNADFFGVFLDSRGTNDQPFGGEKGDLLFVETNSSTGYVYLIRDSDPSNLMILSDPADTIDRYCEFTLLNPNERFDFEPFAAPIGNFEKSRLPLSATPIQKTTFLAELVNDSSNSESSSIPSEWLNALDGTRNRDPDMLLGLYISDDARFTNVLKSVTVSNGQMFLERRGKSLFLCVKYRHDEFLSKKQIEALRSYTRDQFTDGGGDGWIQQLNEETDKVNLVFLSDNITHDRESASTSN